MPRKDTSTDVRAMLGQAGEQFRRPSSQLRDAATDVQPAAAPTPESDVVELRPDHQSGRQVAEPAGNSRARRTTKKPPETPGDEGAVNAPRTIRLSQPKANVLRDAWIGARLAGDVLLTYQDFSDRVMTLGLEALRAGEK